MLETIIAMIVASLFIAVVVYLTHLTLKSITNWLRNRAEVANKHEIGFLIKEALANGETKVIRGVFNKSTEIVGECEANVVKKMDRKLTKAKKVLTYSWR